MTECHGNRIARVQRAWGSSSLNRTRHSLWWQWPSDKQLSARHCPCTRRTNEFESEHGTKKICKNTLRTGQKRSGDPMDEAGRQSRSSTKICFHQGQVGILFPLPLYRRHRVPKQLDTFTSSLAKKPDLSPRMPHVFKRCIS